jgi:hypothetical protein
MTDIHKILSIGVKTLNNEKMELHMNSNLNTAGYTSNSEHLKSHIS